MKMTTTVAVFTNERGDPKNVFGFLVEYKIKIMYFLYLVLATARADSGFPFFCVLHNNGYNRRRFLHVRQLYWPQSAHDDNCRLLHGSVGDWGDVRGQCHTA